MAYLLISFLYVFIYLSHSLPPSRDITNQFHITIIITNNQYYIFHTYTLTLYYTILFYSIDDKLRFASPAGLASLAGRLFVADSEACSVRSVNLIEG